MDISHTEIKRLQAEVEHWREKSEYYRIRCLKFIAAARQLMDCEKQRQNHQDEHKERYNEDIWIPPRSSLYQQSIKCTGDILHGI